MGSRGRPSQPVVDDDDEGFTATKWVPASQRANSSTKELEDEALQKNNELTDATLNLKKITEETKGVATDTLVTLKNQGDQLNRIHGKAVQTDQELEKGEALLGKLGGMFSLGWKPKKGKKITGPKDYGQGNSVSGDDGSREGLGLSGGNKAGVRPKTEGMDAKQKIAADRKYQDKVLDDVSDNLDTLTNMAKEMGNEMDRQDKSMDDLGADLDELKSRVKQSNKRASKLLGRR